MIKRLTSVVAVAVFLMAFASTGVMAKSNSNPNNKPVYYLSLGTSLAAGVQADPVTGESVVTDISYPGILAEMISQDIGKLRHVNIGCPGETAETLIDGGVCDYDKGSQLNQAVQFLHAHGKFTGLITIDVGANEVLQCINGTNIDQICLTETLNQLTIDLTFIMATLREAAPDTQIMGMNYYNPLSVYWFQDPAIAQYTVGLQLWINTTLESVYAGFGIPVADVANAFTSYDLITDSQPNGIPDSIEMLCAWTWMCSHHNIHANALGYSVIAEEFYFLLPEIPVSGPPRKNQ